MKFKIINFLFVFFFSVAISNNLFADSLDDAKDKNIVEKSKELAEEIKKKQSDTEKNIVSEIGSVEEPLPLNDPFVGDTSFTGETVTLSAEEKLEEMSLYNFKLVGMIKGKFDSYIALINKDGEVITLGLHERLSDEVKLVDMRQNEAIFEKGDDQYLIIDFKNQIRETNEY